MAPDSRAVDRETFVQFIRWGIPVVFPPVITGETVGIGTAWIAANAGNPATPDRVEFVWPDADGELRGNALVPLHPRVTAVVRTSPKLHAILAAIDLVRVGGVRERNTGVERIRQLFSTSDE